MSFLEFVFHATDAGHPLAEVLAGLAPDVTPVRDAGHPLVEVLAGLTPGVTPVHTEGAGVLPGYQRAEPAD